MSATDWKAFIVLAKPSGMLLRKIFEAPVQLYFRPEMHVTIFVFVNI